MSRITASATTPRRRGRLARSLYLLGLSLASVAFSAQVYAGCQYVVTNQWNNGFTAAIRITNTGTSPINGWNVSWQYSGGDRITNSWNAEYSGTNPYSASSLNWNAAIQPNQTVEIGFQGTKGGSEAEVPTVTGSVCGSSTSSSASSVPASSSSVSSVASSASNSSVNANAAWDLDSTASYLNFVTTKNTHNVEVHNFGTLSGSISTDGVATLAIDLASVSTGFATRDQRMRDHLFETATYPTATITVNVPSTLLSSLAAGQTTQTSVTAAVDLHGVTTNVTANVSVQRLSASRVLVQSTAPVLTRANTFEMTAGVETLRSLASLTSISAAVPVDFALVFDAR